MEALTPPTGNTATASQEHVMIGAAPRGFERHVVCAIWRTLPAVQAGTDVIGIVPANVYACLNVLGTGTVKVEGASCTSFPPIFLCGPMTVPLQTRATAPLRSLSIVLQPWLLDEWFGVIPRSLVDTWIDGRTLSPALDESVVQALAGALDTPEGLGAALEILAGRRRSADHDFLTLAATLLAANGVAPAAARLGTSTRQFERRFNRGFGLSPKRWLKMKRFEASLVTLARDGGPLADAAAGAGYADQAHMTRDYRQVAGHTPGQTRGALASDAQGYWAFKPAADTALISFGKTGASSQVGFVQDPPGKSL